MMPAVGGLAAKVLTLVQKALDRQAQLAVSRGLGHHSGWIMAVYLEQ